MEKRRFHSTSPLFSRIIAGVWRWHEVPQKEIAELIHAALDEGITTFDHANIYGDYQNEGLFGDVLRKEPSLRNKMQIITKCGICLMSKKRPQHRVKHYDTSRDGIIKETENSLKKLSTDYLDVLLIHRPDPLLDPNEVADALTFLKKQGKILHVGVSNFSPGQFDTLQSYLTFPLITNQIECSVFQTKPLFDGTLDHCLKNRVAPLAWSPLGGGQIANTQNSDQQLITTLSDVATNRGVSLAQYLLAWLLFHPSGIFPIIGTTKPTRLQDCIKAMNVEMDRQEWFELLKISTGRNVP